MPRYVFPDHIYSFVRNCRNFNLFGDFTSLFCTKRLLIYYIRNCLDSPYKQYINPCLNLRAKKEKKKELQLRSDNGY